MADIPIDDPDFSGRGLAVRLGGLFRGPRVVVDGSEVPATRRRYLVRDNHGAEVPIRLVSNHVDPIPKVLLGDRDIRLARPLEWYEYVWIGLPILIAFHGGALGAVFGLLAVRVSAQVFRGAGPATKKFALTGLVSIATVVLYIFASALFLRAIRSRGPMEWSTVTSAPGGFTVSMPGPAKPSTQTVASQRGPLEVHLWIVDRGDTAFMVGYSDFPEDVVTSRTADALLDGARDGMLRSNRGRILAESAVTVQAHPGREIRVSVKDGQVVTRDRFFLVGNRLYQLVAATPTSRPQADAVERFFGSFRLSAGAGKPGS